MASLWSKFGGILRVGGALVFCDLCPCDESSSGSSSYTSGSGGSSGGCTTSTCVEVDCCPGVLIPETLNCTITGGSCPGTVSLVWDGSAWRGANGTLAIDLSCSGTPAGWYFQIDFDAQSPTVNSCDPLSLTADFFGSQCGDITATVTA